METELVSIWATILNKLPQDIGVEDRFQELGGTSFSAMRLVFKIREQLHLNVKVVDFFEAATICDQASVISRLQSGGAQLDDLSNPFVPLPPGGKRVPL